MLLCCSPDLFVTKERFNLLVSMLNFICLCLVRCAPLCHNILWWSDVAVISLHCWNEIRVRKTGSILFALISHLCKSFTSHPLFSTTFARHLNLISYKVFLMPLECIVLLCHTFLPGLSGLCKPRYWVPVLRCTLCGWQLCSVYMLRGDMLAA